MRLRIYVRIKPDLSKYDIKSICKRLYELLGPAVVDKSGWGLLRPGLLNLDLVISVCRTWQAKSKASRIYMRPQIQGDWIIFDYLFSKGTTINPLIKCLSSLGLAKYGEVKIPNTYFVVAGLNPLHGFLLLLYKGREIEREVDSLAYVIAHALNSSQTLKRVVIDEKLLIETAYNLVELGRWKWLGWITKEGKSIPEEAFKIDWNKYRVALKEREWKMIQLGSKFGKISFVLSKKEKFISVNIKRKYLKPGPKRNLSIIFDDLAKAIKPNKLVTVKYSEEDNAGILKAYTERRGIVAAKKLIEKYYRLKPRDVSYQFKGYDLEAKDTKIEVKAFRDSLVKNIQITKHEYEVMLSEENYKLFIVENAWNNTPKVNVINNPRELDFNKKYKLIHQLTVCLEDYYECKENKWRPKISKTELIEI